MADVTGPISTLPGTGHDVPAGAMCDDHPDRPATHRVQGETDSMGCELLDMCATCFAAHRAAARNADTSGNCDWCKQHAPALRNRRDYEEGMSGSVYRVCTPCIDAQNARDEAELARYDNSYFDYKEPPEYDYDD